MELAVFIIDKVNDDPYLDAKCFKRGDVVCWQPDGANWGVEGAAHPWWRILSVDLTEAECETLVAEEPGDPLKNPVLQLRFHKIDLDALPDFVSSQLATPVVNRSAGKHINVAVKDCDYLLLSWQDAVAQAPPEPNPLVTVNADDVRAAIVQKDPLPDPNPPIGPSPTDVIGPS